jgi:hypothetical protein
MADLLDETICTWEKVSTFVAERYVEEVNTLSLSLAAILEHQEESKLLAVVGSFFSTVFRVDLTLSEKETLVAHRADVAVLRVTALRAVLLHARHDPYSAQSGEVNPYHMYLFCRNFNRWVVELPDPPRELAGLLAPSAVPALIESKTPERGLDLSKVVLPLRKMGPHGQELEPDSKEKEDSESKLEKPEQKEGASPAVEPSETSSGAAPVAAKPT